ncbi:hypothetical protein DSM3645_29217 [Blastopirellula marina DSM 3645]|uniref:Uncharacterized protein n=1 Tax=Blastopirellula marina DSM 3645 TaxID=314230 RepID=A3ZPR5_9BACT|nr:hypothetical protein DSM3645_29217 [Blastopirellula marina DSM 3645]
MCFFGWANSVIQFLKGSNLDNPAIVAAWAAAIAAILGPIVSVAMAHAMIRRDERRKTAIELFQRLTIDVVQFGNSVRRLLAKRELMKSKYEREDHNELIENDLDEFTKFFGPLDLCGATLRADILTIDLFFGERGKNCIDAIKTLLENCNTSGLDELDAYYKTNFRKDVHAAYDSIKELHAIEKSGNYLVE